MHQTIFGDAVLVELVHVLPDLRDVVAFLFALPQLPPPLAALLQLHHSIDLTLHWPCMNLQNIPQRVIDLGITALPAFPHVSVAPATNLRWLSAPLPRTTYVRMPLKSCDETSLAFARAWGNRVRHVWVRETDELPEHLHDVLAQCRHLKSADLRSSDATSAALWVAALSRPASSVSSLNLYLTQIYAPAARCMPLAQAILSSPSLASLTLCSATGVQAALVALDWRLPHVTTFSAIETRILPLFEKMDPAKLVKLTCCVSGTVDISRCSALQELSLSYGKPDWAQIAAGRCPDLRTVYLFEVAADADMPYVVQWLHTSRVLRRVHVSSKAMGALGVDAMATALPQWIACGLEAFSFGYSLLSKNELLALVHALTIPRDRPKPLEASLTLGNRALDGDEMCSLLAAIGACSRFTLTINNVQSYPSVNDPELGATVHVEASDKRLVLKSSPRTT